MKAPLRVRAAGLTDRGRQRARNEDAFICDEAEGLFAVADGLGGLPRGELAATTAVERLIALFDGDDAPAEPDWQSLFNRVNGGVIEASQKAGEEGIGTTLTAVRIAKGRMHAGHIGDSGLFVFSSATHATKMTVDHTMAQELIDACGADASGRIPEHYFHTLTQCVGQYAPLTVQTFSLKLTPGTRLLLYTDGVTKTQEMAELAALVFKTATPEALVRTIVEIANARGGPDNVTAVAIFC